MPDGTWEQMIPIRFWRVLKGFRSSRLFGRVGFEISEPARDTKDLQDYHNPLLKLPDELLLLIADFLDQEFQILLSLACKRLRVVLDSSLDLWPCDMSVKLRFLQCLEPDYPGYITCRSCGFMFLWQFRRLTDYRCPLVNCHSLEDHLGSYAWCMQGNPNIWVTREVVDLIFRAQEWGQRYGLPVSFLNTSGTDHNGIARINKPRLVDGQLLIASRWEVDAEFGHDTSEQARRFNSALCLHLGSNVWRVKPWQYVEQAVAEMTGLEKTRVSKCPFCATDHELRVQNSIGGRTTITLSVWRNYGRRNDSMQLKEQMFNHNPSLRIDADAVSRRDLRAVFESHRSSTDSVRGC